MKGKISMRTREVVTKKYDAFQEQRRAYRRLSTLTRDMILIVGFYAISILCLNKFEGWRTINSMYFISATVTTIGYGDKVPSSASGMLFTSLVITPIGIFLVFTTLAKYATYLEEGITFMARAVLEAFGVAFVDVSTLPVESFSPAQIAKIFPLKRKVLSALFPMAMCVVVGTCLTRYFVRGKTWVESFYYTIATVTTVGYGDQTPERTSNRLVVALLIVLFVVVLENTITEIQRLRVHSRLRRVNGRAQPDLEELLLRKIVAGSDAPVITESDFIIEALLLSKVIDVTILTALQRNYFWIANGGNSGDVDARVVHAAALLAHKNPEDRRSCCFRRTSEVKVVVPEDFEVWRRDYWAGRLDEAKRMGELLRLQSPRTARSSSLGSSDGLTLTSTKEEEEEEEEEEQEPSSSSPAVV